MAVGEKESTAEVFLSFRLNFDPNSLTQHCCPKTPLRRGYNEKLSSPQHSSEALVKTTNLLPTYVEAASLGKTEILLSPVRFIQRRVFSFSA